MSARDPMCGGGGGPTAAPCDGLIPALSSSLLPAGSLRRGMDAGLMAVSDCTLAVRPHNGRQPNKLHASPPQVSGDESEWA